MLEIKTVDKPDERRDFPRGHLRSRPLTGLDFAVGTFEPGWRWSESVAPIAGTKSCQIHHNGYVVQGRMRIRMDEGGTRARWAPATSSCAHPGTTPGSSATSSAWSTTSRVAWRRTTRRPSKEAGVPFERVQLAG